MVVKKEVDVEALKQKRKTLSARVAVCEGKIKSLTRELADEKAKPSFKTSKAPRHAKFQDVTRRLLLPPATLNFVQRAGGFLFPGPLFATRAGASFPYPN